MNLDAWRWPYVCPSVVAFSVRPADVVSAAGTELRSVTPDLHIETTPKSQSASLSVTQESE